MLLLLQLWRLITESAAVLILLTLLPEPDLILDFPTAALGPRPPATQMLERLSAQMESPWGLPVVADGPASLAKMVMAELANLKLENKPWPGGTHSLHYHYLALSEPGPDLPQFLAVGYVDDQPFIHYDSRVDRAKPQAPWMATVDAQYWETETQKQRAWAKVQQVETWTVMGYHNQSTGMHSTQRMFGCEIREDGHTHSFWQFSFDGQDHLSLDLETLNWVSAKPAAMRTKSWWETERCYAEYDKAYLEGLCLVSLRRYLELGGQSLTRKEISTDTEPNRMWRERVKESAHVTMEDWEFRDLQLASQRPRRASVSVSVHRQEKTDVPAAGDQAGEPPTVQVTRHTAQDGGITLKCWARGFYPRDISLSWWLGEEELVLETEYVETRPSGDGTYQTWAAVQVPARMEDRYTCHVQHSGLNHTFTVTWEAPPHQWITSAVVIPMLIFLLLTAGVLIFIKQYSQGGEDPPVSPVRMEAAQLLC
ncbi:class I histocompatibility antigen, Gogo-C*0202 alpha chain-like isoform X2 [Mustela erminea]|uniref:class I histocompatibility antigen, Gogo-C*0202 alpha chain-like isoform X2 n=1 Tax=Mustela erminea TaxID=36723 RepID=UPI0013866290|nr:class I histocompatibility antigen, Gogo-C*0202 alpha chain-like isoform X2 [Mustela erminea]